MRCRVCGAELADGMPRCPRCGQPVRPGHTPTYPHGNPASYPTASYPPYPPPNPAETTGEIPAVPPSGPPYSGPPPGPPYTGAPAWPVSGAGAFPYPTQARRRRPWLLLVVLLVVGVTGVVGIGFAAASTISPPKPTPRPTLTSAGPTTASPSPESGSAQAAIQASALNDLLTASGTSRATLGTAIAQVQSCDASSDPLSTMDGVIRDRTGQLRSAQALAVDALPGGEGLRGVLVQLLQKSAEADGDYEAWAQQVLDSACAPDAGAAQLTAASTASGEATTLKKTFLASWNPIASRYGLPQRQDTDL